MNKKDFKNGCFSPAWLETPEKKEKKESKIEYKHKDCETLLKELNEIKEDLNKILKKKEELAFLVRLYTFKEINE